MNKKKFLSGLLVLSLVLSLIVACHKQQNPSVSDISLSSSDVSNVTTDLLRNDSVYLDIMAGTYDLSKLIFAGCNRNQAKFDSAVQAIQILQNDTTLTNDQMFAKLDSILHLPSNKSLKLFYNHFASKWAVLQQKYGSKLTDQYVNQETTEAQKANPENFRVAVPCQDLTSYTLCTAGVTAGAIMAHAACLTTVLAAPACFALVATVQVAGINACSVSYCGTGVFSAS